MALEVQILSGSRQGEVVFTAASEFRVGGDPACDLFFDPRLDHAAAGRMAIFRLKPDGLYLRSGGTGQILINHEPLRGIVRIRSGDIVRLSEAGPDFAIAVIAKIPPTSNAVKPAVVAQPVSVPMATRPPAVTSPQPAAIAAAEPLPQPAVAVAAPTVLPEGALPGTPIRTSGRATSAGAGQRWALWLGGIAAACLIAAVIFRILFPPAQQPIVVQLSPPGSPAVSTADIKPVVPVAPDPVKPTTKPPDPAPNPLPPTTTTPPPSPAVVDAPHAAILLIELRQGKQRWPLCTGVAISKNALITTAREAQQMVALQAKHDLKAWASGKVNGQKAEWEIDTVRVPRAYIDLADKPGDWIYFNIALLTIKGDLPTGAPLATADELKKVKDGLPVRATGHTFEAGKAGEDEEFTPQLTAGKLFVSLTPNNLPRPARVLVVSANMPKNAFGSPLLAASGMVVGLYGEIAPPPDGTPLPAGVVPKHYFTMIDPALLQSGLQNGDAEDWKAVKVERTTEHPPAAPQAK